MKNLLPLTFLSLFLFSTAGFAQTTWYVDQSGNGDFTGIQQAIDAVAWGDIVIVRDGTYIENIRFLYQDVILRSENGPASTIIDGSQAGPVIWFSDGTDATVVDGFTITNGKSTNGGGIEFRFGDTSPTIINNVVVQNTAVWNGGGIYMENECWSRIAGNVISNNRALGGSGGGIYGGTLSGVTITDNTVSENAASSSGGGIFLGSSSPTIISNSITNNMAQLGDGGGLVISGSGQWNRDLIISQNTLTDNQAGGSGGGLALFNISASSVSDHDVSNNTIESNSASEGGGIYLKESSPDLRGNTISNNSSTAQGGGIFAETSSPNISENVISNNSATGEAGGIYCFKSSSPLIEANLVSGNFSSWAGGGLSCKNNSNPVITSNSIVGNMASNRGGGIHCKSSSAPTIVNSIFWNNLALNGPEFYFDSVSPIVQYSDVKGGWAGLGNIDADPNFISGFYLSQTMSGQAMNSPCVDAGNPSTPLPGTTTRTDGVPDSGIVDMGYHYQGPPVGGPTLTVTNLIGGHTAAIDVSNCTPNNTAYFVWSLAGGGPVNTPYGPGYVSSPYIIIPMPTDMSGSASRNQSVPANVSGKDIWFHGVDIGSATLLNPLAMTIQ